MVEAFGSVLELGNLAAKFRFAQMCENSERNEVVFKDYKFATVTPEWHV